MYNTFHKTFSSQNYIKKRYKNERLSFIRIMCKTYSISWNINHPKGSFDNFKKQKKREKNANFLFNRSAQY